MRDHGACHTLFKVKTLGMGYVVLGIVCPSTYGVSTGSERGPQPCAGQRRGRREDWTDGCRPVGARPP